ncbi:ATP-dependent DNA helicase [Polymorphum gilvum]|uniref:ATP-dependent exoDNAse (Exonuclease V) alpha subunit-helicase superfamily I member-like protein n=1 Tax=Polymorphum gilvum (strain LMG 25793 / CGMCC 1.9160 / SL003B-26A1) TaxID=991905 RepID=F2IXR3_POLGS|nr:ATP-dependent RecD-like DNA helicase [Polymorphum gilvum]ADZ69394.1 ATP-dependent exoDNAse (Exonuclease V) alpha subunit-helicase superfamily I member-like protein [Polymorphum gilvum SL003B-26A1]
MLWSAQQDKALTEAAAWLKRGDRQVFRLFGYAGTGKTTLARHLAEGVDGDVCFGAFTGKAAHVLRQKGCADAGTIHSLIYRPRAAKEEDEMGEDDADPGPQFALKRDSAAAGARLIVIDECSMVDEELGRDLLSFGTPVLVLGDPAQLPPVKGGGYFTEAEPDVMLTEVHRQAQDNPIVRLSMTIREGGDLAYGSYGDSRVISRKEIGKERILAADQVLVGTNRTRRLYNNRIRELKGFTTPMPAVGDKLVCLRNDKTKGLLNGGLWTVKRLRPPQGNTLRFDVLPEDEPGKQAVQVKVLPAMFEDGAEQIPYAIRRKADEFDYGYALTVHKAQGSQWDDVVLFDESFAFRDHRERWLYTAVTRAAETITVVR